MRNTLGTTGRLAGHILAVILLLVLLLWNASESSLSAGSALAPAASTPAPARTPSMSFRHDAEPRRNEAFGVGTLDQVQTPAVATRVDASALRPPDGATAPRPAPQPAPGIAATPPEQPATLDNVTPQQPHAEALRPPAGAAAPEVPAAEAVADEPVAAAQPVAMAEAVVPAIAAEPETAPAPTAPDVPAEPESAPQPDESGAIVVAAADTGAITPVAARKPLVNATLEVLGDGVYWLDPGHDLEHELAAVPELRRLVLLTPLPDYRPQEMAFVKTDVIPADPADLTSDAAGHFLHLTGPGGAPVAVAVLPGTLGAAFFKGAYLLRYRKMAFADMLREIDPELEVAGDARDDIIHRLTRLAE